MSVTFLTHPAAVAIEIDLESFVNFATYNGLFDNVSLINYPKLAHKLITEPNHKNFCYVEEIKTDTGVVVNYVLWTISGWIAERKRRNELAKLESHKPQEAVCPFCGKNHHSMFAMCICPCCLKARGEQ